MTKSLFSERAAVIGLGKLGSPMAACLADQGYRVTGVDLDPRKVSVLNEGKPPVDEPGLAAQIAANRDRIQATTDHERAILETDLCFVIVPTPSNPEGAYSLQYAKWAMGEIGKAMRTRDGYYLIVMTATVLPGSCRYGLIPILEEASGKRAGIDFGFCYSPAFIALGSVIRDFLEPDFTLVGQLDDRSGDRLERVYARVMRNGAPCSRMSLENAELAKVSLNAYVTMKISFANSLAAICDRMPGGDVDVITDAIGFDRRIGCSYLKGGAPFGGPCFPRDSRAFAFSAGRLGVEAKLAGTTDAVNRDLVDHLIKRVGELKPSGSTVSLLGLAYKPGTPIVDASPSIELAIRLTDAGYRVVAYDPLAAEAARPLLAHRAVIQDTVPFCLEGADLVLVTTPDPVFEALEEADFARCAKGTVVFDLWRLLASKLAGSHRVDYVAFGQGGSSALDGGRLLEDLWGKG